MPVNEDSYWSGSDIGENRLGEVNISLGESTWYPHIHMRKVTAWADEDFAIHKPITQNLNSDIP